MNEVVRVVREALEHRDTLVTHWLQGPVPVWYELVHALLGERSSGELAARCATEVADLDRANESLLARTVLCKLVGVGVSVRGNVGYWDSADRVFALIREQDCIPEEYAAMQAVLGDRSLSAVTLNCYMSCDAADDTVKIEGHQTIGDVLENIGHGDMKVWHRKALGQFIKAMMPTVRIRPRTLVHRETGSFRAITYFPYEIDRVRELTRQWITEHYQERWHPKQKGRPPGDGMRGTASNSQSSHRRRDKRFSNARAGDWRCTNDECRDMVFAKHSECQLCGTPKPLEMCADAATDEHSVSAAPGPALGTPSGRPKITPGSDGTPKPSDATSTLPLDLHTTATHSSRTIEWSAVADASQAEVVAALARRLVKAGDISGAQAKVIELVTSAQNSCKELSNARDGVGSRASDRAVMALVEELLAGGRHRAHAEKLLVCMVAQNGSVPPILPTS